ncbi:unnamed protein product [Discosporangium mesarthrocarpum]
MIGNSRLHWAVLSGDAVLEAWDSEHLGRIRQELQEEGVGEYVNSPCGEGGIPVYLLSAKARTLGDTQVELRAEDGQAERKVAFYPSRGRFRVASVVPAELDRWILRCPDIVPILSRHAISGTDLYPTLGVDRALAVRGAALKWGWPVLVVDCGSALTFTAGTRDRRLGGGAILPGLRLQLMALANHTAQLPRVALPDELPPRWAMSTVEAIQSGVIWSIVGGIRGFVEDWLLTQRSMHDEGGALTVVFTGGDSKVLHKAILDVWKCGQCDHHVMSRVQLKLVGEVIHWGIASVVLEEGDLASA